MAKVKKLNLREFSEELKRILEQIIKKYNPEKVILFGSLAEGKVDPSASDIDLFIVKKNVPKEGRERVYELDKLIDYKISADFVVFTPREFASSLKRNDPFVKYIVKKGKVLYERR